MAAPTGWAEIDQLVDLGKLFVDGKVSYLHGCVRCMCPTSASLPSSLPPFLPSSLLLAQCLMLQEYSFQAEDLKEGDELGEGAFGTVTKMFHSASQTHMAVKARLDHGGCTRVLTPTAATGATMWSRVTKVYPCSPRATNATVSRPQTLLYDLGTRRQYAVTGHH